MTPTNNFHFPPDAAAYPESHLFYVGTYTGPKSQGIYLLRLDRSSATLTSLGLVGEVANPSFLALAPNRHFLYAVNEIEEFAGQKSGAVSAFAISPESGRLTLLNQKPSGGVGPAFVTVSSDGRHLLTANYTNGSAATLSCGEDGRLSEPVSVVQHSGSGANPRRQSGPHAHSVNLDPSGRLALVADLGIDRIMLYHFDAATGMLSPHNPPSVETEPGSGPRHLTFSPDGRFAYLSLEMASRVNAYAYDAARGVLREIQTLSTLPEDFSGENTTAELRLSRSGRFLYVSNRGHDSIAVFAVDAHNGHLSLVGHCSSGGKNPRHFAIDPSNSFLVVANSGSDNLALLRLDSQSGMPSLTAQSEPLGSPVCVRFR